MVSTTTRGVWGVLLFVLALAAQAQDRTLSVASPESSGQRLALVIGNSAYKVGPLRNPANDARAMANALRATGFDVMHGENLSHRKLFEMTRDFGRKLGPGVVALFYYAGHGLQVRDRNFLIPVEADPQSEEEVPYTSVDVNFLLDVMNRAKSRVNIVILDACRNNPFARSFRSGSGGLAQMDAPSGTLIAYATAPGRVASDGAGDHGLYTQHLLKHLNTPGLPVEILFKRVREGVERETKSQQIPWESSSLKGDFYFTAAAPVAAPARPDAALTTELAFWDSIKGSQLAADYQAYLATYPGGRFASLAKARVSALERQAGQRADSLDADFWDSIKASSNPAEYQAYLEQFPEGRFASLARARINSLKVAAAKPAQVAAPLPAPTAAPASAAPPTQVATISPTPVPAAPGAPAVGQKWVYQYTDLWKDAVKGSLIAEVVEVREGEVTENLSIDFDGRAGKRQTVWPLRAELREWDAGPLGIRELSPYALALGLLNPAQAPAVNSRPLEENSTRPWTINVRVSEEDVAVPAGRFRATKLAVTGRRDASPGAPGAFEMVVWYAPETKRYVKLSYTSYLSLRGIGNSTDPWHRYVHELVSAPR